MNRNESFAHDLLEAGNEHFQMTSHPRRVLFWTADSNGSCEVVSANWTEFTGQTLAAAHGTGWLEVILPEDRARVTEALRFAIGAQRGFYLHYRVSGPDCLIRRVLHDASVRVLPSGKFNGLIGTLTDESDCAAGEKLLQQSMLQVYEFLDGVKLAALAIDAQGQLVHVNPVMAAQIGQSRGDLIGCDWIRQHVTAEDRPLLSGLFDGNTPLAELPSEFEFQVETLAGPRLYR